MLDLHNLFESNVISQEVRESIEAAWNNKLTEHREQLASQLREEFAAKYEHDKTAMVEAVDRMINDQLLSEIAEFNDDRKQLVEMKAKYAKKMHKDSKIVKEFVTRALAGEIKELHEDQIAAADKFKALENFVIEALAQEITEFYTDKQDLANTKVKLIKEGRNELNNLRQKFIKRAAELVESTVESQLNREIVTLKEDIEAARRSDFGRRLFEAFASEYQISYLNERSEMAKLQQEINARENAIAEAAAAVVKAERLLEQKQAEIARLKESKTRQEIMNDLLAPLNASQRDVMNELMESVQTHKLVESFDRYLPAVIADAKPYQKRQALVEARAVTGDRSPANISQSAEDILAIRKLAGLNI